jgi:hypothetical protein
MISDGFPHYVHLITEKLLWQVFEDTEELHRSQPPHYSKAVAAAVVDIEPHLKAMYEKASMKYKSDYESVLWAVADHHELKRRSTDIFASYTRIMRTMGEEALDRPMNRGVLLQRSMCPRFIIIGGVCAEDPAQMRFTDHDHVVEAFPSDRADKSLSISILLG